ncbi:hypothetical protein DOY81_007326 [Sarcophaga bullata]|nr:hypothetical protein DOY81_007326 [Sarcophaga bullata]
MRLQPLNFKVSVVLVPRGGNMIKVVIEVDTVLPQFVLHAVIRELNFIVVSSSWPSSSATPAKFMLQHEVHIQMMF